ALPGRDLVAKHVVIRRRLGSEELAESPVHDEAVTVRSVDLQPNWSMREDAFEERCRIVDSAKALPNRGELVHGFPSREMHPRDSYKDGAKASAIVKTTVWQKCPNAKYLEESFFCRLAPRPFRWLLVTC